MLPSNPLMHVDLVPVLPLGLAGNQLHVCSTPGCWSAPFDSPQVSTLLKCFLTMGERPPDARWPGCITVAPPPASFAPQSQPYSCACSQWVSPPLTQYGLGASLPALPLLHSPLGLNPAEVLPHNG